MISRSRDEQGQAVLALLVTAALLGLGLFLTVALPYSSAADGSAKARTAADAAALAGAQAARTALLTALGAKGWKGGWDALGTEPALASKEAAEDYAEANDGGLATHGHLAGRTSVEVTADDLVEGVRPRSSASAQLALPSCSTEALPLPELPEEEPEEEPSPGPDDEEPEPEPDPPIRLPDLRVDCDRGVGSFVLSPDPATLPAGSPTDLVKYLLSPGQLKKLADAMDVRLVA